tara:strand:- start:98 stop:1060 length:963 start_codon:yes stop_codon:yes gene_type:complete
MGFLAGVVAEINRQEDAATRAEEFMRELLEKRKAVVIPELMERIEDRTEAAAERTARVDYAQSFGLSKQSSIALEMSGQLEFELAKLEKIGKGKVSENYIKSLDTFITNSVDSNEKLAKGIAAGIEAMSENMSDADAMSALMTALNATTDEEFSEAVTGINVKAPSFPSTKDFEYRNLAGTRIETPELVRMNTQIANALQSTFGEGWNLKGEGDMQYISFKDDDLTRLFTELSEQAKKRVESAVPGMGVGSPADVSLFIGKALQNARRQDTDGNPVVAKPIEIYNNISDILASPTTFDWSSLPTQSVDVPSNPNTQEEGL